MWNCPPKPVPPIRRRLVITDEHTSSASGRRTSTKSTVGFRSLSTPWALPSINRAALGRSRKATTPPRVLLRYTSKGGFGECGNAAPGESQRRLWAGYGAHWYVLPMSRVRTDCSASPTFAIFAQILRMRFPAPRARIAKGSRSRTRHACVWRTGLPAFVRRLR